MKRILVFVLVAFVAVMLCCCTDKTAGEQTDISQDNSNNVEDTAQPIDPVPTDEEQPAEPESNLEGAEDTTVTDDVTHLYEIPGEYDVTLYFPDSDFLYLHAETRKVTVADGENLAEKVINELFKGPVSSELAMALTGEDLINSVSVSHDGICTVDFKGDFAVLNSGGTTGEAFAIGSIVNSVCGLDGIDKVKFNIDGNDNANFGGHYTFEAPISPQTDLIKE